MSNIKSGDTLRTKGVVKSKGNLVTLEADRILTAKTVGHQWLNTRETYGIFPIFAFEKVSPVVASGPCQSSPVQVRA